MWSEDDFQYAAENTEVILAPEHRIATFGATSFRFYLISELMDRANEVRVRDGHIHAASLPAPSSRASMMRGRFAC
jgi:hypothetical protein